jgi:DNA polymerase-3 subunit alpha
MKPIVGCEFYVCEDHKDKTRKDNGYQIVLLAKTGYHNLANVFNSLHSGFLLCPELISMEKSRF